MAIQRRKKEPKSDLHVTINPLVVEYFEALRSIHKREYSEFVEEKLLDLIKEVAPEKYLEMKLATAEKEVIDIKQAMIEVKLLRSIDLEKQKAKESQAKLAEDENSKNDQYRNEKYEQNKFSIASQVNKKLMDWKVFSEVYRFNNFHEAEDWATTKLNSDKLLGCESCKKMNVKKQSCANYPRKTDFNDTCLNWEKR